MTELEVIVSSNRRVSDSYYVLSLDGSPGEYVPGQFIQILCRTTGESAPFLRRPFSVMRQRGSRLDVLYKVIGPGTQAMQAFTRGQQVSIIGPLGHGFDLNIKKNEPVIVVAGGTGIGGVYYLLLAMRKAGAKIHFLYGIKYERDVPQKELAALRVNCEVVSEEKTGFVTVRLAELDLKKYARAYVCGPTPMMRKTVELLEPHVPFIEVSLEEMMGCGYGICYTCPVKRRDAPGYFRACCEGPVFEQRLIVL